MQGKMRFLYISDIMGETGIASLEQSRDELMKEYEPHLIICNVENSAPDGFGTTYRIYRRLKGIGVHLMTSGNHIWSKKEIVKDLDKMEDLLRPLNFPPGSPGSGMRLIHLNRNNLNCRVAVINLIGRIFMDPADCPFRKFDEVYSFLKENSDIIIIDFHAEATSEKRAFAFHVDGRASVLIGSHTHVQTADEMIMSGGLGYITDAGMTGSLNSVIGTEPSTTLLRFISGFSGRLKVETSFPRIIQGVAGEIDAGSGKCLKIERVNKILFEKA